MGGEFNLILIYKSSDISFQFISRMSSLSAFRSEVCGISSLFSKSVQLTGGQGGRMPYMLLFAKQCLCVCVCFFTCRDLALGDKLTKPGFSGCLSEISFTVAAETQVPLNKLNLVQYNMSVAGIKANVCAVVSSFITLKAEHYWRSFSVELATSAHQGLGCFVCCQSHAKLEKQTSVNLPREHKEAENGCA